MYCTKCLYCFLSLITIIPWCFYNNKKLGVEFNFHSRQTYTSQFSTYNNNSFLIAYRKLTNMNVNKVFIVALVLYDKRLIKWTSRWLIFCRCSLAIPPENNKKPRYFLYIYEERFVQNHIVDFSISVNVNYSRLGNY